MKVDASLFMACATKCAVGQSEPVRVTQADRITDCIYCDIIRDRGQTYSVISVQIRVRQEFLFLYTVKKKKSCCELATGIQRGQRHLYYRLR